jgi:hypothetical protein
MGYMTDGLTFNTLRQANLKRLPLFKNKKVNLRILHLMVLIGQFLIGMKVYLGN